MRLEAHKLLKNGFFDHTRAIKSDNPLYIEQLIGKFNFWKQVEPENEYVVNMLRRLYEMKEYESATQT